MNKKTLCGVLCLLAALAIEFSNPSAAEKIKKEKSKVFILLGRSNTTVGPADTKTFQHLLQNPYQPGFEEAECILSLKLSSKEQLLELAKKLEQAADDEALKEILET